MACAFIASLAGFVLEVTDRSLALTSQWAIVLNQSEVSRMAGVQGSKLAEPRLDSTRRGLQPAR